MWRLIEKWKRWCGGEKLCHLLHLTSQNVMNDCTFQITKTNIYLSSNSHMNWIRSITRHGIYCLFTLLQVTKWEQEEQVWAGLSSNKLHCTESVHGISIHYTLYTPHRQVWPELARQPGPRTALAPCNRLPWNRDSITTLLITLHFSSFLYTYITCF